MTLFLTGCIGRQVIPISYEPETAKLSKAQPGHYDYESAAKAIASVMVEKLKFPRIETVLIIYPSLSEYEAGFLTEMESTPAQAAARTHFGAIASCKYKKVLVNGHRLSRLPWRERVKTLAHEMTHIVQHSLSNSTCVSSHPWLREGFANWVAYKILEELKLDTFANGKKTSVDSVGSFKSSRLLPTLSQMSSPADWAYWVRSLGSDATYGQSFLAVDFLIEQKGLPATIEYFGLFGHTNSRPMNFTTAFGEELSSFEKKFTDHLQKLLM